MAFAKGLADLAFFSLVPIDGDYRPATGVGQVLLLQKGSTGESRTDRTAPVEAKLGVKNVERQSQYADFFENKSTRPDSPGNKGSHSVHGVNVMSTGQLNGVIRRIHKLAGLRELGACSDGQLLERFVNEQDEHAFEGLLQRHGPIVIGTAIF